MNDDYSVREWEAHVYDFLEAPVPDEILDHGARVVADILAATVAGAANPAIEDVTMDAAFGDGPATVLGTARQTSVPQAALVNSAAAIIQEAEEGHNTGGHVGAGIVAGGVTTAEMAGTSGEMFVAACVRSYEVCVRLERAIFAMKDRLNETTPWLLRDPHSTWTTVGPALTAAQCLGASAAELRETFRIAANLAVVSMYDPYAEGPPARNFTAGFSAQAGVSAALTATAGLTGSVSAIKAVYDPFDNLLSNGVFDKWFTELGDHWEVQQSYFKPYPSCRYTHPPLDALREALSTADLGEAQPEDVQSVLIRTFSNAVEMAHSDPETPTSAKFSTPYVLARYLYDRDVSLASFEPNALDDPDVKALASRVRLEHHDDHETAFPENWGATVEVLLQDGRQLVGKRSFPCGDHRDDRSDSEFRSRLRDLFSWRFDETQANNALKATLDIRNRDIRAVIAELQLEE